MSRLRSGEGSRPATPAERELWLASQLADDATAFTTAHAFQFDTRLDAVALALAWDALVVAAPQLSSRFVAEGADIRVVSTAEHAPRLRVGEAKDAEAVAREMSRTRGIIFDAETGPLAHVELIRRTDEYQDILVIALSHLIADGFAWSILLSALQQGYEALRAGAPFAAISFPEPAPPIVSADSEAWAVRNLAALPHPSRRPDPVRQARPRAIIPLPDSIRARNLPEIALAAAALVAPGMRERPRAVVDVPFLARSAAQLRMPSTAMNVVPIAIDTSVTETSDLLACCAAALADAKRHVVARTEQARRQRSADGALPPVADVALNVIPFVHELVFDGRAGSVSTLSSGPGDTPAIAVRARADGTFQVEVDVAAPDDAEAERRSRELANRFADAVASLGAGRLPSPLPLLAPRQDSEPGLDVIDLIRERVRDQPLKPAFIDGEGATVTYAQLWGTAERLAERIVDRGLVAESAVGVCVSSAPNQAAAVLGVLLAGAAFVPLPADLDEAVSRRRIIDAVHLDLVLVEAAQTDQELAGIPRITINDDAAPEEAPPTSPLPRVDKAGAYPEQLAYVIATSGSTGAPKPVAITRGSLSGWIRAILGDYLPLMPDDRIAQFAAVQFDASLEELFSTLCSGAALVPRSRRALESIGGWLDDCGRAGVTVLDLPTGYWHEMTRAIAAGRARVPESVRTVIIGGEAASPEHLRQWRSCVRDSVRLINTYGPTEATVVATRHVLAGPPIG